MDYHIIIFSRLQSYGGGRETWLNMFLPLLQAKETSSNINVYFYCDKFTKERDRLEILKNKKIIFNEIELPVTNSKITSLIRIFSFTKNVISIMKLKEKDTQETTHLAIAVGSFYEALVVWCYKILRYKSKLISVVWLRSIWQKQARVMHSNISYKIVAFLEILFLKKANLIISNGYDTSKAYLELGFPSEVIPNCVNLKRYKGSERVNNLIVISFIGRLSKEKGLLDFLESVKIFNNDNPSLREMVRFEVVGDGPLEEILKNYDSQNLIVKGAINNTDMNNYLDNINVGLALTYANKDIGGAGVSNGLLELMASEKLIICWDNPIYNQILNTNSAIIIEESNVLSLANCYVNIVNNYNDLIELPKNARKIAYEYSEENHVHKFMKIIKDLKQ